MTRIRTILHPTDFSERAGYAFELACSLARDYNARLVLVYVRESPMMPTLEGGCLPMAVPEPAEICRAQLDAQVPEGVKNVQREVLVGDTTSEILWMAEETSTDLIVMGTHGRGGLGRLVMGSVAEQVRRRSPCPVVTVNQPVLERSSASTSEGRTVAVKG